MNRFPIAAIVISTALTSACSRLIPGYEVLPVPQPIEIYQAGKSWIPGIGPSGDPLSETVRGDGVDQLNAKDELDAQLQLAGVFSDWVSGNLALGKHSIKTLKLGRLHHETIADVRAVTENGPLLWETIIVDSMTLELTDDTGIDITAEGIGTRLTAAIGGSAKFTARATSKTSYAITSDKPVVAAIRVAELSYRTNPDSDAAPLDLETMAVGTPQPTRFGYVLILQEPVDPIRHTAILRIQNSSLPQFTGVTHQFANNDTWISDKRTVTTGSDRSIKDAQSVWDSLSIIWFPTLAQCKVTCVRQYLLLKPVSSKLKGTL